MPNQHEKRVSTGIEGLDEVLQGGLIPRRAYLVRGGPGTGKTTVGLHFLAAGAARKEKVLFITLGEKEEQIHQNAASMGIDLTGVSFLDLSPTSEFFSKVQTYDIFSPAEVERVPTAEKIINMVEKIKPARVFIDAVDQFRYLASDPFQFRRQIVGLFRFLLENKATVLFTSEGTPQNPDDDLQFLSDAVLDLGFPSQDRSLSVRKFRGSGFRSGSHSFRMGEGGIKVFPKLIPEEHKKEFTPETISFGVPEVDEMLHGGLERGTSTIITGPSGVGKTTLGLLFMKEAAGRGERSVIYTFEEEKQSLLHRAEAVNIPVSSMIKQGTLSVVKVEPLRFSPDELAYLVREEVEEKKARIVMIDSVKGYRLSLGEEELTSNIHTLSKYLTNMGVSCLLVNEVESITGSFRATEVGISYLVDNILFLRYLEMKGKLRRAIGVLKKRLGSFEASLREFKITRYGVKVGEPLTSLQGILSGMPELTEPPEEG